MTDGMAYDTGTPTLDVHVYEDGRLLAREICESEEDASALVERWQDVANVSGLVDDLTSKHGPDDILAPEEPLIEDEEDFPIVDTPLPGYGTE